MCQLLKKYHQEMWVRVDKNRSLSCFAKLDKALKGMRLETCFMLSLRNGRISVIPWKHLTRRSADVIVFVAGLVSFSHAISLYRKY